MVNDKPSVVAKSKYNVTQTAQKLGISRRTLYRYIDRCLIKPVFNKCNNRPMFYGSDIIKLWGAEY